MDNKTSQVSILMVGRIYEEEQVFKLIEQASELFSTDILTMLYFTDSKTQNKMKLKHSQFNCIVFVPVEHHSLIDYIVTIGGDGTILYAAKEFKSRVPPLITFQRGSLGFMCRFHLNQMDSTISKLIKFHKKQIECPFQQTRIMRLLALKSNRENRSQLTKVCINQVYISRKSYERITLQIYVNGQFFTHTAGDGILISTPTGSTAYSLSAGGPILQNGVNCMMIVPIAPNSLSFRPICLPSDSEIKLKLHKLSRSGAYLSFDGQSIQDFVFGDELVIKKSEHDIVFYQPSKNEIKMPSWIQRVKYYLGWNQKYKAPQQQYLPEINTHVNKYECKE